MVEKVAKNFKENPQQVQETLEELDRISLSCLKLLSSECDMLSDMESFEKWGKLVERNQQLLSIGLGVSHPKLDAVCRIAIKNGLHAKLTGAGGGGYAYITLPPNLTQNVLERTKTDLQEINCSVCETTLGASGGVKINVL